MEIKMHVSLRCVRVCVCMCARVCVWGGVRYRAVGGGGRSVLSGGGAAAPPAGQTEGAAADRRSHTHTPGAEPAAETPAESGQTGNTHTHTHTCSDREHPALLLELTSTCLSVRTCVRCWAGSQRGR